MTCFFFSSINIFILKDLRQHRSFIIFLNVFFVGVQVFLSGGAPKPDMVEMHCTSFHFAR
jgi:hypothetical protein